MIHTPREENNRRNILFLWLKREQHKKEEPSICNVHAKNGRHQISFFFPSKIVTHELGNAEGIEVVYLDRASMTSFVYGAEPALENSWLASSFVTEFFDRRREREREKGRERERERERDEDSMKSLHLRDAH